MFPSQHLPFALPFALRLPLATSGLRNPSLHTLIHCAHHSVRDGHVGSRLANVEDDQMDLHGC